MPCLPFPRDDRRIRLFLLALCALTAAWAAPTAAAQEKTIGARTAGMQRIEGFQTLYWDAASGKLFMEIPRFNAEFLYQVSLQTGVGSNPIGLDRGQLGDTAVVYFERIGPKVLLVQPNYRYRALSQNPAERRAVQESFARSVLWGFQVEALEGDHVLVDATAFFLRDAHRVADRLREAGQGRFGADDGRSAIYMPATKGFPRNTEVDTLVTLAASDPPGPLVRETVPTPQAVTIRQHHSLVELPDAGYTPRTFDPRVGAIPLEFYDYAAPISEPLEKRWIIRHRLQKKDPSAAVSEPVEPIVYYVDDGTPEPIRTALVEGASWWNAAFEAAGFKNAFQVKILPPGADPMDIRYNIISWVHRSTRGWAYGASVVDPRTGEIIKGSVTLDSQRARQDYLLLTGLEPLHPGAGTRPGPGGGCGQAFAPDADYLVALDPAADPTSLAVARIRQLSAHEVGHTLGLTHNFAASTYGRASVMDYPAPLVEIRSGKLDLSNAYATGIGAYDLFAIKYAYSQFPRDEPERAELERIVSEGISAGMLFISDADARPAGAAHPLANLWDNGSDPVAMLRHAMRVRGIGLAQFGLGNIPPSTPLSLLEAKLLPLYLHHRYQLQAAVKSLGGLAYSYAVRTSNGASPTSVGEVVPAATQRDALAAVLETLSADALEIPPRALAVIPPTAYGYGGGTAELFAKRTDPVFDPIAAATIAADLAVSALLQPNRAARLIDYHARDAGNPDFTEVVTALIARTWRPPAPKSSHGEAIVRAVQSLTVTRLTELAANPDAAPEVRAVATDALRRLAAALAAAPGAGINGIHRRATRDEIERFLTRPDSPRRPTTPLPIPSGDPIGSGGD